MNYTVAYIEVDPAATDKASDLLKGLGSACLQETARPNRFVILSESGITIDAKLSPLLITAVDQRHHDALAVEDFEIQEKALFVVTHIDVIPPEKETGAALIAQMCLDSRKDEGCLSCVAWAQMDRPNHMTVVEQWQHAAAQSAHAVNAPMKNFRQALAPLSGALYDERFYQLVR